LLQMIILCCLAQEALRERRMLGLQGDFAMLFESSNTGGGQGSAASGGAHTFWLGKVQRLIRTGSGRSKVEYRQPVDLDSYDGAIVLVAEWYKPVAAQDSSCQSQCIDSAESVVDSLYALVEPDHKCYDIQHVLAPVQLSVHHHDGAAGSTLRYALNKKDRMAIDEAIAEIAAYKAAATTGRGKRRLDTQNRTDDGRRVVPGSTSSRGRQRSEVQFQHS
jgi:hypothetical protein